MKFIKEGEEVCLQGIPHGQATTIQRELQCQ